MPRTRSVLVDNTIGRIFRNVAAVSQATPANVIAGEKLTTKAITSKSTLKVSTNIGGRGIFLVSGGLVTQLVLRLSKPARGSNVVIRARKGATYATSTEVALYSFLSATTETVSISLTTGESLFFDIVEVGSIFPGTGLTILAGYYAG